MTFKRFAGKVIVPLALFGPPPHQYAPVRPSTLTVKLLPGFVEPEAGVSAAVSPAAFTAVKVTIEKAKTMDSPIDNLLRIVFFMFFILAIILLLKLIMVTDIGQREYLCSIETKNTHLGD